jgi:hypothetical protein
MYPVARVSIKYWNNLRTQQSIFFSARFYCALLTLHVSAPFGGLLQEYVTYVQDSGGKPKRKESNTLMYI